MTQLSPRAIYDPQPTRYIDRWRCDQQECPIQGTVWEPDEWEAHAKKVIEKYGLLWHALINERLQ
jgi:hypothetical protein